MYMCDTDCILCFSPRGVHTPQHAHHPSPSNNFQAEKSNPSICLSFSAYLYLSILGAIHLSLTFLCSLSLSDLFLSSLSSPLSPTSIQAKRSFSFNLSSNRKQSLFFSSFLHFSRRGDLSPLSSSASSSRD